MDNTDRKKQLNPILWFLFAIIIPIIVVTTLVIFILSLANISVLDWAKDKGSNVPVISSIIKNKEEKQLEQKLTEANEMIEEQKGEIKSLSKEITTYKLTIEDLENLLKIEQSKNREDENESNETPNADINTEETIAVNGVEIATASFRKMEPERAAKILENVSASSSAIILSELSSKVRGDILAEMDSEKAAALTEIMFSE